MAGSLFGLGLSQQFYQGVPANGALLYIYSSGGSTPSTTYSDFALTTTQTFPVVADSDGRLPPLWVADGTYRARLTTSTGVVIFDYDGVVSIGASSGSSSTGSSVNSQTIFNTGDPIWVPISGTRSGWVRANGRTLGSGSSSATERANGDTQSLFEYLWNNYSNTICAVSSGRGGSATADFNSNKTIGLLDLRGRFGGAGLDDMGNSAASRIVGGTPTTAATTGGAETTTIAQGNLPNVTLSAASLTGSVSTTISGGSNVAHGSGTSSDMATSGSTNRLTSASVSAVSLADGTVTFGGNVPLGGSGTAATTISPYMLGTWYLKL